MQDGISGMAQFVPWIIAAVSLAVAALAIMRGGSGDIARLLDREADERARDAEYQRAHLAEVERALSGRMDQLRLETSGGSDPEGWAGSG